MKLCCYDGIFGLCEFYASHDTIVSSNEFWKVFTFFSVWQHFVFVFCSSKIFHTCSSFVLFNIYFCMCVFLVWRLNSTKLGVPGFHFLNILKNSTKFLPFFPHYLSLPISFLNLFLYLVVKEDDEAQFIQWNVGINLKSNDDSLRVLYFW